MMVATCKLGTNGCWNDGKCRATCNCENKMITNGDKIRAMSDEELADFINGISHLCGNSYDGSCLSCKEPWCEIHIILEWLEMPSEM
jgi:hypothetical protein